MYIQENPVEKERTAPPDYRGHTYVAEPPLSEREAEPTPSEMQEMHPAAENEGAPSTPVGAFAPREHTPKEERVGAAGLGGLFSRIPFLSSLAPPPRSCGEGARKHGELWDFVLLAVLALALLNGRDDDVMPLLLLLLLWD